MRQMGGTVISIHAPVKGATSHWTHRAGSYGNFNPRTREGCDGRENRPQEKRLGHFNPRTRKGCDQPRPPLLPRSAYFNPRTREACDFDFLLIEINFRRISIHAPVKGATCFSWPPDGRRLYFNPRTREGCDWT